MKKRGYKTPSFMEKISIFTLSLCFMLVIASPFIVGCDEQRETSREVYYPPNDYGEPMINVHHRNSNGSYTDYFMAVALYNQLHANGGVENVHRYYQTHPETFRNNSMYKSRYSRVDKRPSTIKRQEARKLQKVREERSQRKSSNYSPSKSSSNSSSYRPAKSYSSSRPSSFSSSRSSSRSSSSSSRRR